MKTEGGNLILWYSKNFCKMWNTLGNVFSWKRPSCDFCRILGTRYPDYKSNWSRSLLALSAKPEHGGIQVVCVCFCVALFLSRVLVLARGLDRACKLRDAAGRVHRSIISRTFASLLPNISETSRTRLLHLLLIVNTLFSDLRICMTHRRRLLFNTDWDGDRGLGLLVEEADRSRPVTIEPEPDDRDRHGLSPTSSTHVQTHLELVGPPPSRYLAYRNLDWYFFCTVCFEPLCGRRVPQQS